MRKLLMCELACIECLPRSGQAGASGVQASASEGKRGASGSASEGVLPDSASGCQCNRRMVSTYSGVMSEYHYPFFNAV